ncbi:MAG: helix-turn-helix domain-containing protein [Armatimonadetes bacterium]|nr:helix-turn-helix domain-containing protein [Armatimonadota bacterium]MDE2205398.1 helix-turn-helix domain-containing protein [Armatimonadota bacterium]
MDLSTRSGRREQGLRIQGAIERAGMSAEELAGRVGCSRALVYQYLSGATLAQPDRLQRIASVCGVDLALFYQDDGPDVRRTPPPDVEDRLRSSLEALEALAQAQQSPADLHAAASACQQALTLAQQLNDTGARIRAFHRLGATRLALAEYPEAVEALSQAVSLSASSGDAGAEIAARQCLGAALISLGRDADAEAEFVRTSAGPTVSGRWRGTLSLGGIAEMRGDYATAMARFDDVAAMLEDAATAGELSAAELATGLLYVNMNRTNVYLDGGDFEGARTLAQQCLVDAESLGIAAQGLEARFNLAWCDFATGTLADSWRGLLALRQLARFLGDGGREAFANAWLAILLSAAGDADASVTCGKEGLAQALATGDRRAELYAQLGLADSYSADVRRRNEARYHATQALAVTVSQRQERGEIECRLRLARLAALEANRADLEHQASLALAAAHRLGARHLECIAMVWSGNSRLAASDVPEAERLGASANDLAREIGSAEGIWRSHSLLAASAARRGDTTAQEQHLRSSVDMLESLRAQLRIAGLPDTLMENGECLTVYAELLAVLRAAGRDDAVAELLELAAWPPLADEPGAIR